MLLDLNGYSFESIQKAASRNALEEIVMPLDCWLALARAMYIGYIPKLYKVSSDGEDSSRNLINAIQCLLVNNYQITDSYYARFVGFGS